MPELPEVEGLRSWLAERCVGKAYERVELAQIAALKTFEIPLGALGGLVIDGAERWGKFVGLSASGVWLIWHLARAGWLQWKDTMSASPARPGKGPLALRVALDDGSGFDLTEAGTQRKLAIYVVDDPGKVPGIASLGVDPLGAEFTRDALSEVLAKAGKAQLKGVLRDQGTLAGIGNAYSDEILHAAKLSPFRPAGNLTPEEVNALYAALRGTLQEAIARCVGAKPAELKDGKRAAMAVHGRTGLPCPVCGTDVAEVSFADSALQYCPGCQTGGKPLADRRLSRLLK